ncbi:MAG: helix-turn-helix domain-containing protein [Acidimicrobiia bacterium]
MVYEIGPVLREARDSAGLRQQDVASELGITQQTVSRWESGRSRPGRDQLLALAGVLGINDEIGLLARAGHDVVESPPPRPVRPRLRRLPLGDLSPGDFEWFCRDFVSMRHGAEVHRFGGTGHAQAGIDLIAYLPDGSTVTYQCKRVKEFGPSRFKDVVTSTTIAADTHHLLLSRDATPDLRKEAERYSNWILEDVDDISAAVRFELSGVDARQLVDTYFPGWRHDFLGISGPGLWLTPDEFFRPTLRPGSILSHAWTLVGRKDELAAIHDLMSSSASAIVICGRGGMGKTRILREVADRYSRDPRFASVLFAAPEVRFDATHLEDLPEAPGVLVVDDAHDRDDLGHLVAALSRADRGWKLLMTTRPHGKDQLMADLHGTGLVGMNDDSLVEISDVDLDDVEALALEVLSAHDGPEEASRAVARATRDCPLFTVIAAQLVAAGKADPNTLADDPTARAALMRSFREAIIGDLGDSTDRATLSEVVRLVALTQPVIVDNQDWLRIAEQIVDQRADLVSRHLRSLEGAGVLTRRGRQLRVVPDLLADFLVADSSVDAKTGIPTGYADLVFSLAKGGTARSVILNIAKLDWRVSRERESDSTVLDAIWGAVTSQALDSGIYGREALLRDLTDVSYFQPRRSLDLARKLIEEPTDMIDTDARAFLGRSVDYQIVLSALPRFLHGAAYHIDHLGEVADLLWQIGRDQEGMLHSIPDHAVRILQELAAIKPNWPLDFSSCVVDRAISWTKDPRLGDYLHSPFDVMEAVVATEGYDTESRGWTLAFVPFGINVDMVRPLRNRVVEQALTLLNHDDVRIGVRCAQLIGEALRGPLGAFGRRVDEAESKRWTAEFVSTLQRLEDKLREASLDSIVADRLRQELGWHAKHGEETRPAAVRVISMLSTALESRLTRALAHGWAHSADLPEEDDLSYQELELRWRDTQRQVAVDLRKAFPAPEEAMDLVEGRLRALKAASREVQPSPHPFLAQLFDEWEQAADETLRRVKSQPRGVLGECTQIALAAMHRHQPQHLPKLAAELLDVDDAFLDAQVAYALLGTARVEKLTSDELRLIEELARHSDHTVRHAVSRGLRFAQALDPTDRVRLLMNVPIQGSAVIAEELLGAFGRFGDVELSALSDGQVERLLDELVSCHDIEGYEIAQFLSELSANDPWAVVELLKRRLDHPETRSDEGDYRPIPYRWNDSSPLVVRQTADFPAVVGHICDWLSEPAEGWRRSFWAPRLLSATVGKIDDRVLDELDRWAGSRDPERLELIAHLVQEGEAELVWRRVDWVTSLLERAAAQGADCYGKVAGGLHAMVISGTRVGTPGEPFREDIEQRDRSRQIATSLRRGSPAHRFYTSLARSAESSIRRTLERHEEDRPD